jgi:hypothetical protein
MNRGAILTRSRDLRHTLDLLETSVRSISDREQNFQQSHSDYPAKIADINRLRRAIENHYKDASIYAKDIVQMIESLRKEEVQEPTESGAQPPSADRVQKMMQDFFTGEIKHRSAPIPTYCGCYAFRAPKANFGNFVCANIKGSYILMIVLESSADTCSVFDPTENEPTIIKLNKDEWTPLPTVIPEKPLKRWEHAKGSTVLSLWRNRDEWTTEFYKALVKLPPCERPETEERGYTLDFGENNVMNVPEKFVVTFPDSWKKQEAEKGNA